MATRQAAQQLLPRRIIFGRSAIASAAAPCAAASRRGCAAALRPVATTTAAAAARFGWRSSQDQDCHRVRWYSNESQVPSSRIWRFDEIKKLVEAKDGEEEEGKKEKVVIVDVREPSELLDTGKIPGAINIPITSAVQSFHVSDADFEDMYGFARPPRDATLLFYCKAGVRARGAAGLAQHAGWTSVGEYPGSWLEWEMHQGPVERVSRRGAKGGQ